MEIAFYARVSTLGPQQVQTIDQQIERLHAAADVHNDWHMKEEHIFRDDGYSGAKLNRSRLDRLRDLAAMAAFELACIDYESGSVGAQVRPSSAAGGGIRGFGMHHPLCRPSDERYPP
jgi:site-specific DNA recombinase